MIETKNKTSERAILIALNTKDLSREVVEEHIKELEELARTAGAETILKIIQNGFSIDSAYYLGKGKAEELVSHVELNDIDLLIFDDDLSPVQVRNLERLIDKKIIDRSGLILDIFASRAKSREAKTQVELAQLQYLLPRLTRAWTHLSKQYGGIGTKGPGETQIETDRRIIRSRISHLKQNLSKIESQRITQSSERKNFTRISLAGYTNAGKSTLFNLLTKSDVFAEDKLFATLDSTTRAIDLIKNQKMLLSDTVGFIRKLPAHLVASFKSTLNEVRDSDLILHVVDISHNYFQDHIKVVEKTLKELGCESKPSILVFNKVDLLSDRARTEFIKHEFPNSIIISAVKGFNIQKLFKALLVIVEDSSVERTLKLKITDSKTAALIHSLAKVKSITYEEEVMKMKIRTSKRNADKIDSLIRN